MKTKVSSLIALLCILVYVVAVLSAAFQIYANVLEQQQSGTRELDKVQNLITQSGEVFFTEPFRETIKKTLEDCKVLQGLIITSDPKTELSFENGWGSAIRWDNGPHFITRIGYVTLPPRQVTVPGYKDVGVYSMIRAVQFEFMADVCKQTLLIILAALLLSFLNMIITMLRSREKSAEASGSKKNADKKQAAGKQAAPENSPPPDPAPVDDVEYNIVDIDDDLNAGIDTDIDIDTDINADDFDVNAIVDDDTDDAFVVDNVIDDDMSDLPDIDNDIEMSGLPDIDEGIEMSGLPGIEDDDMSDLPGIDNYDLVPEQEDIAPISVEPVISEPDMPEPEISELPDIEDDFSLPEFDNLPISQNQADSLTDDDFHLDDFVDESSLNLPEVASIDDIDEITADETNNDEEASFDLQVEDDDMTELVSDSLHPPAKGPIPVGPSGGPPDGSAAPSGLYSPRSNVGWEAYTLERLASELHRCAASEQDLVIMLMECAASVLCEGKLYKKIADEAIDLFNLKDLTFEYGKRGFTVIIPNESLEQGILKANEFHDRIYKTCFDSFQKTNDFFIGISSRSGRLVEADKLLYEASRALEKAREEPESPVIAFKSDPEKYREYVRRHF